MRCRDWTRPDKRVSAKLGNTYRIAGSLRAELGKYENDRKVHQAIKIRATIMDTASSHWMRLAGVREECE